MSDTTEQERKARLLTQALSQLTTTASASHPIIPPKPKNETDRVGLIILSNLATKDD